MYQCLGAELHIYLKFIECIELVHIIIVIHSDSIFIIFIVSDHSTCSEEGLFVNNVKNV